MKKFKFIKPFDSFFVMNYNDSIKERWRIALHDPAYLLLWVAMLMFFGYILTVYFK